jgi:hypothetical protein
MRNLSSVYCLSLCILVALASASSFAQEPSGDKFVYADFERIENGRVVSNNGGFIQVFGGQESTPVRFTGQANTSPTAPELVRSKDNDKNHLARFDYSMSNPNQWANVTLEIQGHPTNNGKQVADDVSGYKNLSVQMFTDKAEYLRVEFISHDQGINLQFGFPQLVIKIKPGLNTYLIPLKGLQQPSWVEQRVDSKEVMKKLTAVSISAFCNDCTPQHGMVVVDNLIFQK